MEQNNQIEFLDESQMAERSAAPAFADIQQNGHQKWKICRTIIMIMLIFIATIGIGWFFWSFLVFFTFKNR